jgi:hypothetical protein
VKLEVVRFVSATLSGRSGSLDDTHRSATRALSGVLSARLAATTAGVVLDSTEVVPDASEGILDPLGGVPVQDRAQTS